MEPFQILQEEMYDAILSKVKDPLDKLNLARVHPHLEDAFSASTPEWHFASILPSVFSWLYGPRGQSLPKYYLVYNHNQGNVENANVANAAAAQNPNPDLHPDAGEAILQQDPVEAELALDPDDLAEDFEEVKVNLELLQGLRNCRGISKLLCETVDDYTERHSEKFSDWYSHYLSPPSFASIEWYKRRKVAQFLNDSEGYHTFKNPGLSYITGWCQIGFDPADPKPTDRQIVDLCRRFAGHTRHIQLDVFLLGLHPLNVSNLLNDVLSASPNIQSLSIEFYAEEDALLEMEQAPAPDTLILPDLPNLEVISFRNANQFDDCVPACVNLKKYFPQLKKLFLELKMWRTEYNYWSTGQIQFPVLEEFCLGNFDVLKDQEKLFGLLFHLKAPKMKWIKLHGFGRADDKEKFECGVYFLQQMAVYALNQRDSGNPYRAIFRSGVYRCSRMQGYCYIYLTDGSIEPKFPLWPHEIQ